MDCFLWEGRKVFFRVTLAILKVHELKILSMVDPVTIFQFIKEVAKHIFDMDELFEVLSSCGKLLSVNIKQLLIPSQAAFKELQPFPSRAFITNRCSHLAGMFVNEWKEREQQKTVLKSSLEPVFQVSSTCTCTGQRIARHVVLLI